MNEKGLETIIVGAGIAGLSCARHLTQKGVRVRVFEAADRVGGRVKTDRLDGFLLDHGFQVLQTAYPENRRTLDMDALALRPYAPGVILRIGRRFWPVADPLRRPVNILTTAAAPIGTLADRLRLVRMARQINNQKVEALFRTPDRPVLEYLRAEGFSEKMIARFFRPFFTGVCLDPQLAVSHNVFRFVFRMFGTGDVALPQGGMGAIPAQLAAGLGPNCVRTGTEVIALVPGGVRLATGEIFTAPTVVIATAEPQARKLLKQPLPKNGSMCEWCLYFASDAPPVTAPMLIVNANQSGVVNSVSCPNRVASDYAPAGQSLVSVVVVGDRFDSEGEAQRVVRSEMTQWFGNRTRQWRFLKAYRIEHALPAQRPPMPDPFSVNPRRTPGLYVCGESGSIPGIQWAMLSGRMAAERIIDDTIR